MKLTIHITKEILQKSLLCGTNYKLIPESNSGQVGKNCAVALAIRDIFPEAIIGRYSMSYSFTTRINTELPNIAKNFIRKFDNLKDNHKERLNLNEISFDIDVPYEVINSIGIDDYKNIIKKSKSLSLTE